MLDKYQELLLDILHYDTGKPGEDQFVALGAADWDALITAAIGYRLAYQLHDYLCAHPPIRSLAPAPSLDRLTRVIRRQLKRNFSQYLRLRTVLTACEQAGLPIILFKGLWLVEHIYKAPIARPSGDIDFLVQPDNMAAFTTVARQIGCVIPNEIANLQLLAPASNEYALPYGNESRLDVHWSVAHPKESPISEGSFWDRSEETTVGGTRCRTFRLEDHLLFLCFHAAIHHKFVYVGPRAFMDCAAFIATPPRPIDWEDFINRAVELGWTRGAWLTLDLVRERLGIAPPQFVLDRLQPADVPSDDLRAKVLEALFLDQVRTVNATPLNVVRLKGGTLNQKLCLLLERLFPSRKEIATQFAIPGGGGLRLFLAYSTRLLRLTRHLPSFVKTIRGDSEQKRSDERAIAISDWLDRINSSSYEHEG